jgi:transposase
MSWLREYDGEGNRRDFPPWQTVYTYFRNWRKDGTWLYIHNRLREWTRIDIERHPSPSEAIIDSQSVKTAAMVSHVTYTIK